MEDKENFPCPDCGQQTMQLIKDQELLRCNNCNLELTLDTYAMSLQIAQKELIIQALKLFLEPGTGRCIKYNNKYYIVGFDKNYDIIVEKYELKQNEEEGMYVKISYENQEEV